MHRDSQVHCRLPSLRLANESNIDTTLAVHVPFFFTLLLVSVRSIFRPIRMCCFLSSRTLSALLIKCRRMETVATRVLSLPPSSFCKRYGTSFPECGSARKIAENLFSTISPRRGITIKNIKKISIHHYHYHVSASGTAQASCI